MYIGAPISDTVLFKGIGEPSLTMFYINEFSTLMRQLKVRYQFYIFSSKRKTETEINEVGQNRYKMCF